MTNDEVHNQLNGWLLDLLGVPFIKDRQQVDRPAKTYGMTDLINWGNVHQNVDKINYEDTDTNNSEGLPNVMATPDLEVEWMFTCFLYGAQGENLVRRLQSAVHLTQLQEPLRPALVIHEVGRSNSIPELVGERWEPRTQVNIVVRGKSSDGFIIDVIEEHDFTFTGERA